ncbi:MAG: hypothetical protein IAE94_06775 [Chthoniobacterales bacterium]|nr:hypothetical protein [Chthoniobacterales bacterium]
MKKNLLMKFREFSLLRKSFVRPLFVAFLVPILSVALAMAEGEVVVQLDLEGLPAGVLAAGTGVAMPISVPNRVTVAEPNQVAVEENFTNGSGTFEGRSLVLRKESPDGECAADFVFAGVGLPNPGIVVFEAEILFETSGQSGNASINFRGSKNELLYYLQIGANGGLLATAGEASRRIESSLAMETPVKVRIVLDFSAGSASLQINSQNIEGTLPLARAETLRSLGFSIAGNRRAFAVRSVNVTMQ